MPTSDLQRMHQDEWLSALRSGEYEKILSDLGADRYRCAVGVGCDVGGFENDYRLFAEWLGASAFMVEAVYRRNDGSLIGGHAHSFDEIADWFKAERDAHDGDLSEWEPA